jgi:hypothetical protein
MIDLHGLRRRRHVLCLLYDRHFGNSHLMIRYLFETLIDVGDMKCCSFNLIPGHSPILTL